MDAIREQKYARYPELVEASGLGVLKFMVLPCEVGGRWGEEWFTLIRCLAKEKARSAPAILRKSTEYNWSTRWWSMLAVAAQSSYVGTLVESELGHYRDGSIPSHGEVLSDFRYEQGQDVSRLPLRG